MVKQNVYWCPTIYVGAYVAEGRGGIWPRMVELERIAFGKALKKRVRISYGTDAGGYAWTENQAKELSYMVRYGMTPMQAIQSATSVAAAAGGRGARPAASAEAEAAAEAAGSQAAQGGAAAAGAPSCRHHGGRDPARVPSARRPHRGRGDGARRGTGAGLRRVRARRRRYRSPRFRRAARPLLPAGDALSERSRA